MPFPVFFFCWGGGGRSGGALPNRHDWACADLRSTYTGDIKFIVCLGRTWGFHPNFPGGAIYPCPRGATSQILSGGYFPGLEDFSITSSLLTKGIP